MNRTLAAIILFAAPISAVAQQQSDHAMLNGGYIIECPGPSSSEIGSPVGSTDVIKLTEKDKINGSISIRSFLGYQVQSDGTKIYGVWTEAWVRNISSMMSSMMASHYEPQLSIPLGIIMDARNPCPIFSQSEK